MNAAKAAWHVRVDVAWEARALEGAASPSGIASCCATSSPTMFTGIRGINMRMSGLIYEPIQAALRWFLRNVDAMP